MWTVFRGCISQAIETSGSSLQCVLLLGWVREGWGSFSQRNGKLLFSSSVFPCLFGEQDLMTVVLVYKRNNGPFFVVIFY